MANILSLLGPAISGGTALSTLAVTTVTTADTFLADSPSGGIGYTTGAGASVTQGTSKATGATLSAACGTITTHAASLAAGAEVSFIVTNTIVVATDIPLVCIKSGGTVGAYTIFVSAVGTGSFTLTIANLTTGALAEALVISFGLLRVVSA